MPPTLITRRTFGLSVWSAAVLLQTGVGMSQTLTARSEPSAS
jgi:hypothetical protein